MAETIPAQLSSVGSSGVDALRLKPDRTGIKIP